jgi:hypothetical protein
MKQELYYLNMVVERPDLQTVLAIRYRFSGDCSATVEASRHSPGRMLPALTAIGNLYSCDEPFAHTLQASHKQAQ